MSWALYGVHYFKVVVVSGLVVLLRGQPPSRSAVPMKGSTSSITVGWCVSSGIQMNARTQ